VVFELYTRRVNETPKSVKCHEFRSATWHSIHTRWFVSLWYRHLHDVSSWPTSSAFVSLITGTWCNWWWSPDIGYPLLDAELSLCTAPWSRTLCRTTSAHSRTMSPLEFRPLDRARKPGFSPDTSLFSALETFVTIALYKSTFTIPYHTTGVVRYRLVHRLQLPAMDDGVHRVSQQEAQLSPRDRAICVVSVEILPTATQQCRNYLYDKSWTNQSYEVGRLQWDNV